LIKAAKLEFPSPCWDEISEMAKDLIRKIIVADPSKRLTPDEILAHPWIVGEKTPRSALKMMEKLKQYQNKH
jgi:serine/threonine protein kinase